MSKESAQEFSIHPFSCESHLTNHCAKMASQAYISSLEESYLIKENPTSFTVEFKSKALEIDSELVKSSHKSAQHLKDIRQEIIDNGEEPVDALVSAMKENRILAIGEGHYEIEPQRDLGAKIIPLLKEAGATHLAIEVPENIQSYINEYEKTGKLAVEKLPCLLQSDNYIRILDAARRNDIKVLAVDRSLYNFKNDMIYADYDGVGMQQPSRDQVMATNIGNILRDTPNSKVIFWVGSGHLHQNHNGIQPKYRNASTLLKDAGYSICTFRGEYGCKSNSPSLLMQIAGDTNSPVSISTNKTKKLGDLTVYNPQVRPVNQYKEWDQIIIYPWLKKQF